MMPIEAIVKATRNEMALIDMRLATIIQIFTDNNSGRKPLSDIERDALIQEVKKTNIRLEELNQCLIEYEGDYYKQFKGFFAKYNERL